MFSGPATPRRFAGSVHPDHWEGQDLRLDHFIGTLQVDVTLVGPGRNREWRAGDLDTLAARPEFSALPPDTLNHGLGIQGAQTAAHTAQDARAFGALKDALADEEEALLGHMRLIGQWYVMSVVLSLYAAGSPAS